MTRPSRLCTALAVFLVASASTGPVIAVASPTASATRSSRVHAVALRDIAFKPATLRIRRGDRVRWTWDDGPATPHNVVSRGKLGFKSASTRTEGTYSVRFRRSGTYAYVCTIHLGMRGRIIVR